VGEDLDATVARERAAFRAYLDALEETVRSGRELEAALDLVPLEDRRDYLEAIVDRIDHVHELRRRG
jgi:phage terminase Nu1 subunit (DNA packaging protein)